MTSNPTAERAFLGCYMLNANAGRYEAAQHGINADTAYTQDDTQAAWLAIQSLEDAGKWVDLVSIMSATGQDMHLRLQQMVDAVCAADYAGHYAEQVADAATARQAQDLCDSLSSELLSSRNAAETIREHTTQLSELGLADTTQVHRVGAFADVKIKQWEAANRGEAIGVPFCISAVDGVLGGLRLGMMSVLAAYRGTGKSTLARQQAHFAATRGYPTLLITLEDTAEMADAGIAGRESGVSVFHLDIGQASNVDRDLMRDAWKSMAEMPLWIVDRNAGMSTLSAIVERKVRDEGIKLVIVDHIQYIAPQNMPHLNRTDTLAHYSNTLCGWAKDYNLHVMALSQLSNSAEKENRKTVRMSDIRGCGSIADDCRQAMALYELDAGHVLDVVKNNAGVSNKKIPVIRCDGKQMFAIDEKRMQ